MEKLKVVAPKQKNIVGKIKLNGSKSISNRALIIRALCDDDFEIENLSSAKDTVTLNSKLNNLDSYIDAGAGGTTYRFLTAFLCTQKKPFELTGTQRMKERPIGVLAEALKSLGADIQYLENEGYPPLKIDGSNISGGKVVMPGNVSSQYLSALLMIAPTLAGGLELQWEGTLVSRPYLQMTLNLMQYFGAEWEWTDNSIIVKEGKYKAKDFFVEGDWSAASYYYSIAALADTAEITLEGLDEESVQGDSVVAKMGDLLQVHSEFNAEDKTVTIRKSTIAKASEFYFDFLECPDLAQTIIAMLTGLTINGAFQGLQTLKIKETDRVAAMRNEMAKYNANFKELDLENWVLESVDSKAPESAPVFPTYEDHRMAMAIAPLALTFGDLIIEEPDVVNKSYPKFWEDLERLGFEVE